MAAARLGHTPAEFLKTYAMEIEEAAVRSSDVMQNALDG